MFADILHRAGIKDGDHQWIAKDSLPRQAVYLLAAATVSALSAAAVEQNHSTLDFFLELYCKYHFVAIKQLTGKSPSVRSAVEYTLANTFHGFRQLVKCN